LVEVAVVAMIVEAVVEAGVELLRTVEELILTPALEL
jgi:hypothetical protein